MSRDRTQNAILYAAIACLVILGLGLVSMAVGIGWIVGWG